MEKSIVSKVLTVVITALFNKPYRIRKYDAFGNKTDEYVDERNKAGKLVNTCSRIDILLPGHQQVETLQATKVFSSLMKTGQIGFSALNSIAQKLGSSLLTSSVCRDFPETPDAVDDGTVFDLSINKDKSVLRHTTSTKTGKPITFMSLVYRRPREEVSFE